MRNNKGQFKKGFYVGFGFKKGTIPWNKNKKGIHLSKTTEFKKGMIPWNKGKATKKLEEYSNGYDAIHEWVERWMGRPKECEKCGNKQRLEWANKSGRYKRVKSDWLRLCKKCHNLYDFENFGARQSFYKR